MRIISRLFIAVMVAACSSQSLPTESTPDDTPPVPGPVTPPPPPPPSSAASVATVTVASPSGTLQVGQTAQLTATARDSAGNVLTGRSTSWSSSDAAVASVSASGLATGMGAGSATITAAVDGKRGTAAFAVALAPAPTPGTYKGWYVTATGSASGAGTSASPWSLQTALSGAGGKVLPGDTVWIRGGTYPNGGSLSVGGTATASVTFSGYPGETAIIKNQFTGTASYVVIQNLVFEGPINAATNQVYLHDCHHVVFTRNEIRNGDFHAGLSVDESHHMTITYNYIHDNGVDVSHDHGIYYKTTNGVGSVIANNLLVRNAARGLSLHDNSGVGVYDVVVAHNTVVANGSTGILVNDGDRMTLVNNIAVGNGDKTGQDQIRVISGNANKIWNNLTWHATASARAGIENTTSSEMSGNKIGNPLLLTYLADLRLQAGSPAINMGLTGWTFGSDYAGKLRTSAPDVGAFEY